MNAEELKIRIPESEFIFSTSRSSGPGGQNVNKVNTKVELRFNIISTSLLSDDEKSMVFTKLKNRINNEGELLLISQSERSQLMNKELVTSKFYDLISKALTVPRRRRSTSPTFASKVKRLEEKKKRGSVKRLRRDSGDQAD